MRTIEIFLASSEELKEDRDQFRNFISVENDRLHKYEIYLQLIQWEHFLDAISNTRLQDEYNNKLKDAELAVFLFFTKAGKYTKEEFKIAHETFKTTGKPMIWCYFKNAAINTGAITEEINSLLSFKKYLQDLGHFPTNYDNIHFLQLHFKRQIDDYLQLKTQPEIEAARSIQTLKPVQEESKPKTNKQEILNLLKNDMDEALEALDTIFLNKNATYNDMSREYINPPNNFSLMTFRSKMRRFVNMNMQ